MCIACWITKATDTLLECVILVDFPQQLWLRERALYYVVPTLPVLLHYYCYYYYYCADPSGRAV